VEFYLTYENTCRPKKGVSLKGEMTAFEEFGVMPELGAAVDEMGWLLPTDVQVR